tara:strand:- start:70 stop:534 length:465 start_codon:yes stop_codon:yes gene_type:complete
MSGIAVKLPLAQSTVDGFNTTKTIEETIRQNLKTLLLTRPGERVMDPQFGVGVDTYLFESFTEATYTSLKQNITQQVATYMPQIAIRNLFVNQSGQDANQLGLTIEFRITPLGTTDVLDLPVATVDGATPATRLGVSVTDNLLATRSGMTGLGY